MINKEFEQLIEWMLERLKSIPETTDYGIGLSNAYNDCIKKAKELQSATNSSQPTPEQQDVNQWTELAERVAEKVIPQFWHCPTEYKKEVITALTEMAEKAYEMGLADSMVYAGLQQQLADEETRRISAEVALDSMKQQLAEKEAENAKLQKYINKKGHI